MIHCILKYKGNIYLNNGRKKKKKTMAEICPRVNDYSYHFIPRKNDRRIYSGDPLEEREGVNLMSVYV